MLARWWRPAKARARAGGHAPHDERAPLKALFLHRLYRLVLLDARPTLSPDERRLVNHALDATYHDCVRAGVRTQARALLGLPRVR
jgi:hypothetical protein